MAAAVKSPLQSLQRHYNSFENKEKWMCAASSGMVHTVERLLEAGQQVDTRGVYGCTALWIASKKGTLSVVRVLLAAGASTAITDTGLDNDTPLHMVRVTASVLA